MIVFVQPVAHYTLYIAPQHVITTHVMTLDCSAAKETMVNQRNIEIRKMLGLDLPKVEQERFRKWSAINLVRKKVKWLQEIHIELTADHGSVCWLHGFRDGERCAPRS